MSKPKESPRLNYLKVTYINKYPGPRSLKAYRLGITEGQLNRYELATKNGSTPSPQVCRIAQLLDCLLQAGIEPPDPPYEIFE